MVQYVSALCQKPVTLDCRIKRLEIIANTMCPPIYSHRWVQHMVVHSEQYDVGQ
jgi:hypothetical protein